MKFFFLALLGAALFTSGCKKNYEAPKSADSYQPITKGSYWKYNSTSLGGGSPSTQTMTGDAEGLRGKVYYKFQTLIEGSVSNAYYAQKNGEYFLYQVIPGVGIREELYLKEGAATGEIWTHNIGSWLGVNYRIRGVIVAKNTTHVVNGKTYSNVIHTHLRTEAAGSNSSDYRDAGDTDYYIAKGVGIIELKSSANNLNSKLTNYEIK